MFEEWAKKIGRKLKNEENEEIQFKAYQIDEEPQEKEEVAEETPAASFNATATEKDSNISLRLVHPKCFEDVAEIADHLIDGCTVVLNVESLDNVQSARMLDFLNGVTYTTGGEIKLFTKGTYIITPDNVDVSENH